MFEDLAGCPKGAQKCQSEKLRNDARKWFFEGDEFEAWCDAAGYLPQVVRAKARGVDLNGKTWGGWRAEAGKGKRYEERKKYYRKNGL